LRSATKQWTQARKVFEDGDPVIPLGRVISDQTSENDRLSGTNRDSADHISIEEAPLPRRGIDLAYISDRLTNVHSDQSTGVHRGGYLQIYAGIFKLNTLGDVAAIGHGLRSLNGLLIAHLDRRGMVIENHDRWCRNDIHQRIFGQRVNNSPHLTGIIRKGIRKPRDSRRNVIFAKCEQTFTGIVIDRGLEVPLDALLQLVN